MAPTVGGEDDFMNDRLAVREGNAGRKVGR